MISFTELVNRPNLGRGLIPRKIRGRTSGPQARVLQRREGTMGILIDMPRTTDIRSPTERRKVFLPKEAARFRPYTPNVKNAPRAINGSSKSSRNNTPDKAIVNANTRIPETPKTRISYNNRL
jgi:hypothetical protein